MRPFKRSNFRTDVWNSGTCMLESEESHACHQVDHRGDADYPPFPTPIMKGSSLVLIRTDQRRSRRWRATGEPYLIDHFVRSSGSWWLFGTSDTDNWLATQLEGGGADLTNQFVSDGVNAGILGLTLSIYVIIRCFKALGNAMKSIGPEALTSEKFLWGIGSIFTGSIAILFSVTYFDQMQVIWYFLMACVATLPYLPTILRRRKLCLLRNPILTADGKNRIFRCDTFKQFRELGLGEAENVYTVSKSSTLRCLFVFLSRQPRQHLLHRKGAFIGHLKVDLIPACFYRYLSRMPSGNAIKAQLNDET